MSELGSLSVEFTRLAQLTKEPKYYDAIARITDAFQEWQNHTRLPGMWPIYVDASGCERQEYKTPTRQSDGGSVLMKIDKFGKEAETVAGKKVGPLHEPDPAALKLSQAAEGDERWSDKTVVKRGEGTRTVDHSERVPVEKPEPFVSIPDIPGDVGGNRQLNEHSEGAQSDRGPPGNDTSSKFSMPKIEIPECVEHGLNSPTIYGTEQYTLGGMADSTYEYLPKVSCAGSIIY